MRRAVLGAAIASPLWAYASLGLVRAAPGGVRRGRLRVRGARGRGRRAAARAPRRRRRRARRVRSALEVDLRRPPARRLPRRPPRGSEGGAPRAGARVPRRRRAARRALARPRDRRASERRSPRTAGERFSHPPLDGLWRLTVGPNKGLFVYFPLALLGVCGRRPPRADAPRPRARARGVLCVPARHDGRVVVMGRHRRLGPAPPRPARCRSSRRRRPLAAPAAARGRVRRALRARRGRERARRAPARRRPHLVLRDRQAARPHGGGAARIPVLRDGAAIPAEGCGCSRSTTSRITPRLSPLRVNAWLLLRRLAGGDVLAALKTPPWRTDRPGQEVGLPPEQAIPASALVFLTSRSAGRTSGCRSRARPARRTRSSRGSTASTTRRSARRTWSAGTAPSRSPRSSTGAFPRPRRPRRSRRRTASPAGARRSRTSSGRFRPPRRRSPEFGMVLALASRDLGNETRARQVLGQVVAVAPRPAVRPARGHADRRVAATLRKIQYPAAFLAPQGAVTIRRPLAAALLLAGAVLALTADERVFGLMADGRTMVRTAVSMATLGEIGIARGGAVDVARPGGDAVSRYGMGPSLVLARAGAPRARIREGVRHAAPRRRSSSSTRSSSSSSRRSRRASSRAPGERASGPRLGAALATALASPLWAYVALDFSEPLQAALVGGAFAAAAWVVKEPAKESPCPRRALLLAVLAGFLAGFALLSKSLLVILFPAVLAALWAPAGGPRAPARGRLRGLRAARRGVARVRDRPLRPAVRVVRRRALRPPAARRPVAPPRRPEQGPRLLFSPRPPLRRGGLSCS